MKSKFVNLLCGCALALATLTAIGSVGCAPGEAPKSEVTRTGLRPGFLAIEIIGQDLNGEPMKLSDFKGKVVVLEFWSST